MTGVVEGDARETQPCNILLSTGMKILLPSGDLIGGVLRILLREMTGVPAGTNSEGSELERGVELESQGVEVVRVEGGVERRDSWLLARDPVLERSGPEVERKPFWLAFRPGTELGKAGFELLMSGDGRCRADLENMLAGIGAEFGISGDLE